MKVRTKIMGALTVVGAVLFFSVANNLWETNDRTTFQVKQAFYTGEMTCRLQPGTYGQWLGSIKTYKKASDYYFSKHKEEGGVGLSAAPINVTFNGRSTANVSGFLKYELPMDCEKLQVLDSKYLSDPGIRNELIRQTVTEALIQTAPLFTAEEADAPKRDQFREIALAQIKHGIYKKKVKIRYVEDPSNPKKKLSKQVTVLDLDKNGMPQVVEPSPLKKFGITVANFNLKELDWDQVTTDLLAKKKEIDMKATLSKAAAVTAQQNAIKEQAEGAARVAKAEADALVEKKTAVIEEEKLKEVAELQAEKKFQVARLAAKEALENAKKIKANGMAEAAKNRALVAAGLTPLEKATIAKETSIGVARELAKLKLPSTFIGGGGANGAGMSPIQAMGIDAMYNLTKRIGKPPVTK